MSSVNNVGNNSPIYSVNRPGPKPLSQSAAPASAAPARGKDTVELSGNTAASQALKTLKAGGDFRADKVASIKAQIQAGTYDDEAKLDAATDRLLDEIAK
jgi:flagellar biosynthesis anti-sigma factor FlgM